MLSHSFVRGVFVGRIRFLGLHANRAPIPSVQRVGCAMPAILLRVLWVDFRKHFWHVRLLYLQLCVSQLGRCAMEEDVLF